MKSKYSIQEKFDIIMECRNSGLSDYQWCKANDISPSTFYGWVMQVRNHNCEIPEPVGKDSYLPTQKQDVVKLDIVEELNSAYKTSAVNNAINYGMEVSIGKATIKISNDINPMLLSSMMSILGEYLC